MEFTRQISKCGGGDLKSKDSDGSQILSHPASFSLKFIMRVRLLSLLSQAPLEEVVLEEVASHFIPASDQV